MPMLLVQLEYTSLPILCVSRCGVGFPLPSILHSGCGTQREFMTPSLRWGFHANLADHPSHMVGTSSESFRQFLGRVGPGLPFLGSYMHEFEPFMSCPLRALDGFLQAPTARGCIYMY